MAEEQDVFISGISGSIQQWSTEATASKIQGVLTQIVGQNSSILALLNAVKNGTMMSSKELSKVGADIRKTESNVKKREQTERISDQRDSTNELKQTKILGIIPGELKGIVAQLKINEREERKRNILIEQLKSGGMDEQEAKRIVSQDPNAEGHWMKRMKTQGFKSLGIATIFAAGIHEAIETAYGERFDMVRAMRQSGLLHSMEVAGKGFISIAATISDTNFTFGEAADFVDRFSKVVGIRGVKSTLDFVNELAAPKDADGLMQRFAMDFSQVSNMSGQYLESLRIAGQLQGRSDRDLKVGMESFMSNVQLTSNVLKISMEESAELMKNSLSSRDTGLLALLPKAQRDAVMEGMKSIGAQDGPLSDLLSARLAAGSDAAFLLTSEYQQMATTALGRELNKFAMELAPVLETQGNDAFQEALATRMGPFSKQFTEMARQLQAVLLTDDTQAGMFGEVIKTFQMYADADKGISPGGDEDLTQLLAREQQRKAARQAEEAMTQLMPAFTQNLKNLTNANEEFATQAAKTLVAWKDEVAGLTNLSSWQKELVSDFFKGILNLFDRDHLDSTPIANANLKAFEVEEMGLDKNSSPTEISAALTSKRSEIQEMIDEVLKLRSTFTKENFSSGKELEEYMQERLKKMMEIGYTNYGDRKSGDKEQVRLIQLLIAHMTTNQDQMAKLLTEFNK